MIILKLLNHQYKEKVRSSFWQKSLWLNILLGIVSLYLILCISSIGYFADDILQKIYKDRDVIQSFTGILFYYFAFDLMMRFLFQKVPVISIQPYLTLPIKKSTVLHYPLLKTIPGIFNIFALCLILPFYFKTVLPANPAVWSTIWLVTLISIIIINNFIGFLLKKYFVKRPLLVFLILALITVFFLLDFKGAINVIENVTSVFLFPERHPYYGVIPPLMALLSYELAYLMLKRNRYVEERENRVLLISPDFSFLSRYGETGLLMQTELRMIFRNRRTKSIIWLSIIFLLYGFIFYTPSGIDKGFNLLFGGFLVTSATGLLYAQYWFAWESSFFDTFLINRIITLNYLKSKFWLFCFLCLICYILTLPYCLFGHKIFLINLSLLIYNIGVTSFLYILFGLFSRSRIDLGKTQFMNYQGSGASQWLSVIPVMGLPLLIFLLCSLAGNPGAAYLILMIMGAIGMIFYEHILKILVKLFYKKKYRMAVAFRNK